MKKEKVVSSTKKFFRPPVITVMGHIDHGKTTLLDKIRESRVAAKESGGITQHIGASQVIFRTKEGKEERLTFIDTPGHAAFAKMRARGAQVTDIVVLVVAADEGVKPQTKECLSHIKAAGVPFVVAINKIDLPQASVDKVKGELAEIGVVPEDYGGKVTMIPLSAKTGEGVDELLEILVLMGKMLELEADPEGELEGVVIESKLDSRRGAVATILVRNGSLKPRDEIWVEGEKVRVRVLLDERGKPVKIALPSMPVEVLGFSSPPPVGAKVTSSPFSLSQSGKGEGEDKKEEKKEEKKDIFAEEKKEIPVVIKSDVQGTLEAILTNLPSEVKVIHSGVGEVTESDVFLAQAGKGKIIAFRVKTPPQIKKLAQESQVKIEEFEIIYQLFEKLEKEVLTLMEPRINEKIVGEAEILAEFKVKGKRVAGCRVKKGEIEKEKKAYLKRGEEVIGEVKIASMRHEKEEIEKAKEGEEFGAVFSPPIDFKVGDMLISYIIEGEEE